MRVTRATQGGCRMLNLPGHHPIPLIAFCSALFGDGISGSSTPVAFSASTLPTLEAASIRQDMIERHDSVSRRVRVAIDSQANDFFRRNYRIHLCCWCFCCICLGELSNVEEIRKSVDIC